MGWLTYHREKGESNLDHFNKKTGNAGRFIDMATVRNSVIYGAFERASDGKVEGAVILIQWAPNDHFNFGYKDMTESMGPCEAECPERILKQLSPVDELGYDGSSLENARAWRASCQAKIDAANARPKVKPGDTVKFAQPIKFSTGTREVLTLVKGALFRDAYGSLFRLNRDWRRTQDYALL